MEIRKVKIVGCGGIGSHLAEPLSRYLCYTKDRIEVTLIDGDKYEERNKERQQFTQFGNKAQVMAIELRKKFPEILFKVYSEYLTEDNIIFAIREKDEIFLCVDNHQTRKLVSKRCEELDDVLLISGSNEYTDGDVCVYAKKNGMNAKENNRPLTEIAPEINEPNDVNPGEKNDGCAVITNTSPQLLFMNLTIAAIMCNCYYAFKQEKVNFERVCVDIITQSSRAKPELY